MTKDELTLALSAATPVDPLVMMLDTNAVAFNKVLTLADAVNSWSTSTRRHGALLLRVSPLVFAERNAQERRRLADDFDPKRVWQTLASKAIGVLTFDPLTADFVSETLARWFPNGDSWQDAKWERVREMYGDSNPPKLRPARQISATVDWFIAASVPKGSVLVTDDRGSEFARVERSVTYKAALQAITGAGAAVGRGSDSR